MAVKKLPNGKYVADFRDAQGNRYRPQFDTRKEADAAFAAVKTKINRGEFLAPARVPDFSAVAQDWLRSRSDRRAGVVDNYTRHINLYLIPSFGTLKMDRFDARQIEKFRDELHSAPGSRSAPCGR
jgi:Phage integrase, N-terminal SAM-like domain